MNIHNAFNDHKIQIRFYENFYIESILTEILGNKEEFSPISQFLAVMLVKVLSIYSLEKFKYDIIVYRLVITKHEISVLDALSTYYYSSGHKF
jgi:hypothetical protein